MFKLLPHSFLHSFIPSSSSVSQKQMADISQLGKKLNNVNDELVKLEMNSIFADEDQERRHLIAKLDAWKLTEQAFIKDLHPALLSMFSLGYDTLDMLQRFINLDFDSRLETLTTKVENPDDQFDDLTKEEEEEEEQSVEETEEKPDVKKRVLEKMVVTSKALLGEIKQDLENTKRKTLSEWLKENELTPYLPFEWHNLYELRIKAVLTGVELSKLLVQFMFSLNGDEGRLCLLQSKIMSAAATVPPKKQRVVIADKFVSVMNATRYMMSKAKPRGEESVRVRCGGNEVEEEEVLNMVMVQFSEAILDLEFVLCCGSVPDTRRVVAGARMRLEDALGQTLCSIQGLRLRIRKLDDDNGGSWKTLKAFIGKVWNLERYYCR